MSEGIVRRPACGIEQKSVEKLRIRGHGMARKRIGQIALLMSSAVFLAACEDGGSANLFKKKDSGAEVSLNDVESATSVRLVERDIESPEVFQVSESGLWDGRPSLGGVWVAHPDVTEPERVIIRNEESGKFVIGALFKRERDNPGPKFQVSSDAASALGMLAGAPDKLNVTALRRQDVPIGGNAPIAAGDETLPEAAPIETASLDPISAASSALDRVEAGAITPAPVRAAAPATASAPVAPKPKPKPTPASKLEKPYIQIGYFSVEENANNTGVALRNVGVVPKVLKNETSGKTYFRVTVGPASSASERATLLRKVKDLGYSDAYFVTN
jgi:cell division septation protein DedD